MFKVNKNTHLFKVTLFFWKRVHTVSAPRVRVGCPLDQKLANTMILMEEVETKKNAETKQSRYTRSKKK